MKKSGSCDIFLSIGNTDFSLTTWPNRLRAGFKASDEIVNFFIVIFCFTFLKNLPVETGRLLLLMVEN